MFIDCYLFSEIAQQIGHTYYSGLNHYHRILYFNLSDLSQDRVSFKMFIYKVKVDSNDVYNLFQVGLRAVKYQVIEEVPFGDFVKEAALSKKTKNELISILNGTMSADKIVKIYEYSIENGPYHLTNLQILKLHAILAQTKYDLPPCEASSQTFRFLPLFEYYGKKYENAPNLTDYSEKFFEYEAMLGTKRFEYIENIDVKELDEIFSTVVDLIKCRKLTQAQFEEFCEYMYNEERTVFHASYVIAAGYKILPKYKKLFYPYLIYSDPEMALEVFDRSSYTVTEFNYFYKKNYKIADSCGFPNENLKSTKEIFVTDDEYKYI